MNIDELTIGDAKALASMFAGDTGTSAGVASSMVGQYVIVRSRNEGINAGIVEMADETGVVLAQARRLWHHKPAVKTECWYEGVANHGLSADSRISASVSRKVIVEDYSLTECSTVARQSIETAVPHEQG